MFQCKCIGMRTFFCNLIFCCSVAQSCSTLCNPMNYSTPGLPVPHHLPKFAQVHVQESVISPNHLIFLCLTLLLPSVFARIPMSQLFTSGDQNTGVSASASVLPTSIQGWFPFRLTSLISLLFKGLSKVKVTLKSLLQHNSSEASILWCSAFLTVQLSQPYMITRKKIALIIWTFVCRVMTLLFNTLSRFVIAFLPRSKCLLI